MKGLWGSDGDFWEIIIRAGFERVTAAVRAQLDAETFQSVWNAGKAMTLQEAIAYALKEPQSPSSGRSVDSE